MRFLDANFFDRGRTPCWHSGGTAFEET